MHLPLSASASAFPWTETPLVASAPMLNIAMPLLAVSVSSAGGLGFLAAGYDVSTLERNLEEAAQLVERTDTPIRSVFRGTGILPIGVGFLNWGADLDKSVAAIERHRPCAVWLFGPQALPDDLVPWVVRVRAVTSGGTKIWVQVGSVAEAVAAAEVLCPDVLVAQGSDAGGHGLARSASIFTLVPEVCDALKERRQSDIAVVAAGGIVDGRGIAASLTLGSTGVVMGTRFLASVEASIARGYQDEILRASDGGVNTVRSTVYDRVRGITGWPGRYDGRGIINRSYTDATECGMDDEENRALYVKELEKGDSGWGPRARLTTYAGSGVGLVKATLPVAKILDQVRLEARDVIQRFAG
ncbi:putative oxidoreductase [Aspergillus steynii IBT 23096]|uniref:Putative oxidoreductase n=1 Tax=Aspergillus steynii IBT 23096 TaxID=1392250 RepID=A0A2I2GN53_9EURO|nr:putative oxidoreductase [Aspergillus steynii IBT 23096]PLB54280.1 putative oxidoreductase [Aspergillus steynii IBT 23096]